MNNTSVFYKEELIEATLSSFPASTRKLNIVWIFVFLFNGTLSFKPAFYDYEPLSMVLFFASIFFIVFSVMLAFKGIHRKILQKSLKDVVTTNVIEFQSDGFKLTSNQAKIYDNGLFLYQDLKGISYSSEYLYVYIKKNPGVIIFKTNAFSDITFDELLVRFRSLHIRFIGKNPILS